MNNVKKILNELGVKHSNTFLEENFLYSPNYGNLLGVQQILGLYGIDSYGCRFEGREIKSLSLPCVCHLENRFVVVLKTEENNVYYFDEYKSRIENEMCFAQQWDGIALIIKDYSSAYEPNFLLNLVNDVFSFVKYKFLCAFVFVCALMSCLKHIDNSFLLAISICCILGVVITISLLQKENGSHSTLADRVCSLLHDGTCEIVVSSDQAVLSKQFSLAQIGIAFFSSSLLLITLSCDYLFSCSLKSYKSTDCQ